MSGAYLNVNVELPTPSVSQHVDIEGLRFELKDAGNNIWIGQLGGGLFLLRQEGMLAPGVDGRPCVGALWQPACAFSNQVASHHIQGTAAEVVRGMRTWLGERLKAQAAGRKLQ